MDSQLQSLVRHNPAANRFEIDLDGKLAETIYHIRGRKMFITHTEVPPEFAGKGIANALARASLDYARREGLRVFPRCPFVAAFIKRHPEYHDLVDDET